MDTPMFKQLLRFLESNEGQNTKHKMVEEGPLKGQTAIGEYAMMPETIQEMAKKNMRDNVDSPVDPIIRGISPTNKLGFEQVIQDNPHKMDEYTDMYINKVLDKSGGDKKEASDRWLAGANAGAERIKNVRASGEGKSRERKYKEFMNRFNKSEPTPEIEPFPGNQPEDVIMSKPRPKQRMP